MPEAPSFLVYPFSRLTPAACAVVAERVSYAATRLQEIGLSNGVLRRLGAARHRLEQVAQDGSYGRSVSDLRKTAEALALATDFFQLAGVLPDVPGPVITQELGSALAADLVPRSNQMQALEFQTQYWFGMVLARAGLRPGVPPRPATGSHVDFLVEIDSLRLAVEVKRPLHIRSARDAMDRGAGQLRGSGLPGVLVVDLSQCLGADRLITAAIDHPIPLKDMVQPHFKDFASRLSERPRKYNQSDKYARVLCALFYARIFGWQRLDMSQPQGSIFVLSDPYPSACMGLVTTQMERFRVLIRAGFGDLAGGAVQPI